MTPGLQAAISQLEGQWRNLFRRIHRIRRSAAISTTPIAAAQSRAKNDKRRGKPLLRNTSHYSSTCSATNISSGK